MNKTLKPAAVCTLVAVWAVIMTTSAPISVYGTPTTEDDGYIYPDEADTQEEQDQIDEQEHQAWEDAGRPGDTSANDDNSNTDDDGDEIATPPIDDDDDSELPRCEYKVVRDCVLNDLGQTCEVGTIEDACQDVFYGYDGAKYKPGEKIVDPSTHSGDNGGEK
jgi:hypothetical protein